MDIVSPLNDFTSESCGIGDREMPSPAIKAELVCQKRQLEVQLSEVSDETCDQAAALFLKSVDEPGRAARTHAKKPKTDDSAQHYSVQSSAPPCSSPRATDFGQDLGSAQQQASNSFQLRTPQIKTSMGPPAALQFPQLALGSLLLAAQMASDSVQVPGGSMGRSSPLLPATQATLQATTASVIATEVLAAVSRPATRPDACCDAITEAGHDSRHAALDPKSAAWMPPGDLTCTAATQDPGAAAAATQQPYAHQHMLEQQGPLATASTHQTSPGARAADTGTAGRTATGGHQHIALDTGATPSEQPLVAHCSSKVDTSPAAAAAHSTGAMKCEAPPAATAAVNVGDLSSAPRSHPPTLQASTAAGTTQLQLPSWLCEPSAQLTASQAICRASLLSTTAALARLSSPHGAQAPGYLSVWQSAHGNTPQSLPSPTHAAAADTACSSGTPPHNSAGASPAAAAAELSAAAIPAVTSTVYGIPAHESMAATGLVWGFPLSIAAAAAVLQCAPSPVNGDKTRPVLLSQISPQPYQDTHHPSASAGVDAGSSSSTPKAAALRVGSPFDVLAASADVCGHHDGTTAAVLLQAAAKLASHATGRVHQSGRQELQVGHRVHDNAWQQETGNVLHSDSVVLTADDAELSPLAAEDVCSQPAIVLSAHEEGAVVVCIGVQPAKVTALGCDTSLKQQGV